jgi:hypothetical protein
MTKTGRCNLILPDDPFNTPTLSEFVQRLNGTFYVSHLTVKYSESVTIWYGSGSGSESADSYLCLKDPDPALFVSDLQDAYNKYFLLLTFLRYVYIILQTHKTV